MEDIEVSNRQMILQHRPSKMKDVSLFLGFLLLSLAMKHSSLFVRDNMPADNPFITFPHNKLINYVQKIFRCFSFCH